MLGTSLEYDRLIVTTHQHRARIEVWLDDQFVRTLAVHAGWVDVDRNNKFVRRFTATVADATGELTPVGVRDLLAPLGTEVKPFIGLAVPVNISIVMRAETTEDWDSGIGYSVQTTPEGWLTMKDAA